MVKSCPEFNPQLMSIAPQQPAAADKAASKAVVMAEKAAAKAVSEVSEGHEQPLTRVTELSSKSTVIPATAAVIFEKPSDVSTNGFSSSPLAEPPSDPTCSNGPGSGLNGYLENGCNGGGGDSEMEIERDPLYEDFESAIPAPVVSLVQEPMAAAPPPPEPLASEPVAVAAAPSSSSASSVASSEQPALSADENSQDKTDSSASTQKSVRKSGRIREKALKKAAEEEELLQRKSAPPPVATPTLLTVVPNGISPRKLHKKFGKFKSSPEIPDEIHGDEDDAGVGADADGNGGDVHIPMKVKSRWRRSSEMEIGGERSSEGGQLSMEPRVDLTMLKINDVDKTFTVGGAGMSPTTSAAADADFSQELKDLKSDAVMKTEQDLNDLEETKAEIKTRLSSFEHIAENKFVCERRFNKQVRGMECDCALNKDEVRRGVRGCGEDCLNRLLMIECDKACSLGKLCGNKRFQNIQNAPSEVFKTSWKGIGLRATADMDADTFVMEYVGEVLDLPRFRKRAKKYSKNDVQHFYFMALSSELFIDASNKGSISRFINHSCDPNAETQKWTVNGELRVGFFSKRRIRKGEEITFDYKYERYGQHAQKCFCGADNCRQWLGGEPTKDETAAAAAASAAASAAEVGDEDDFWSSDDDEEEETAAAAATPATAAAAATATAAAADKPNEGGAVPPLPSSRRRAAAAAAALPPSSKATSKISGSIPTATAAAAAVSVADKQPKKRGSYVKKKLRKSPRKVKNFEDDYEEEIERFKAAGIRTKSHTVELCRLMMRTTDLSNRLALANLLLNAEKTCRRLFLDYHGLKILHVWMSELGWFRSQDLDLKLILEDVLGALTIPHKTMLVDSKVWGTVTKWSNPEATLPTPIPTPTPTPAGSTIHSESSSRAVTPPPPAKDNDVIIANDVITEEPTSTFVTSHSSSSSPLAVESKNGPEVASLTDDQVTSSTTTVKPEVGGPEIKPEMGVPKEESVESKQAIADVLSAQTVETSATKSESSPAEILPIAKADISAACDVISITAGSDELAEKIRQIQSKALALLDSWKSLEEVFKIPRKVLRAEHEREADEAEARSNRSMKRSYERPRPTSGFPPPPPLIDHGHRSSSGGGWQSGGQSATGFAPPPPPKRETPRFSGFDDVSGEIKRPNLPRDVLRRLFEKKCEREQEEKVKRAKLQALHENKCYYLKIDPAVTPMFPEIPAYYYDPTVGTWYQMPELTPQVDVSWGYSRMARLPLEAFREGDPELPRAENIYPPGVVKVSYLYGRPMSIDPEYCQQEQLRRQRQRRSEALVAILEQPPPPQPPTPPQQQQQMPFIPELPQFYIDPDTGIEIPIPEEQVEARIPAAAAPLPTSAPSLEDDDDDDEDDYDDKKLLASCRTAAAAAANNEPTLDLSDEPPVVQTLAGGNKLLTAAAAPGRASSGTTPPDSSVVTARPLGSAAPNGGGGGGNNGSSAVRDVVIRLPSRWRIAKDAEGRAYYYNVETNQTQWEPPPDESSLENSTSENGNENAETEEITVVEMETVSTDSEAGEDDYNDDSDDEDEDDSDKEGGELDAKNNKNTETAAAASASAAASAAVTGESSSSKTSEAAAADAASSGMCSDLGAQERQLLMASNKRKSKEERQHERRQKRERDREKREYERKRRRERHGKHRRDGLVLEKLIPRRTDKTDMMSFDEIRERLANRDAIRERQAIEEQAEDERDREEERKKRIQAEREKAALAALAANAAAAGSAGSAASSTASAASQQAQAAAAVAAAARQELLEASASSSTKPTTLAAADTSSEVARKIRDRFMKDISKVIVKVLDPYRRAENSAIKTTDDFKHLAKKLTNYILTKELKQCRRIEDLKCSDSVKKKAAEFVKKYMSKYSGGGDGSKRSHSNSPQQPPPQGGGGGGVGGAQLK